MLQGVENHLHIPLAGLGLDEVASLAAALGTESLQDEVVRRLYQDTGGHPLYLRTLLTEGSGFDPKAPGRPALPGPWPPPSVITCAGRRRRPGSSWRCSRC